MKTRQLLLAAVTTLVMAATAGQQATAQTLKVHRASGAATVTNSPKVGDVNGDGAIDVADISAIIDCMAGKNGITKEVADVNSDNSVDVADIAAVIDIMAGNAEQIDELYEIVGGDIYDFLSANGDASIADVQVYLKKYSSRVTSEVRNNILYVYIDGYEFICDALGMTGADRSDGSTEDVSDANEIMNSINAALYPGNNTSMARTDNDNIYQKRVKRHTNGTGNILYLTASNILFWDPYCENERTYYQKFSLNVNGVNIEVALAQNGLKAIHECDKYSIVNIRCHGTPEGYLMIPQKMNDVNYEEQLKALGMKFGTDYVEGVCETPKHNTNGQIMKDGEGKVVMEHVKTFAIKKDGLNKLLPSDMSHTILWMNTCFSDAVNSAIKKTAEEKNVPAFAGADVKVTDFVSDSKLSSFIPLFYGGALASSAARSAFNTSETSGNTISSPYNYTNVKQKNVHGTYSFYYSRDMMYKPSITAMSS